MSSLQESHRHPKKQTKKPSFIYGGIQYNPTILLFYGTFFLVLISVKIHHNTAKYYVGHIKKWFGEKIRSLSWKLGVHPWKWKIAVFHQFWLFFTAATNFGYFVHLDILCKSFTNSHTNNWKSLSALFNFLLNLEIHFFKFGLLLKNSISRKVS